MLFLSHLRVARNNRDPADFCIAADPDAAAEMLSADRKGHSLLEFLHDHAITKLYLDHDAYFDEAPSAAQTAALRADVLNKASSIAMILGGAIFAMRTGATRSRLSRSTAPSRFGPTTIKSQPWIRRSR